MQENDSEDMKNKYNTGVPMSLEEMSEEEIDQAMHVWAEGSESLEKVLKESYKNGLLSHACCAGGPEPHAMFPYIAFNLHNEKSRKIAIYLTEKLIESELDCKIDFYHNFLLNEAMPNDYPTRDIIGFDIQILMQNREEVFGKMLEILKEIEKVDLDKIELPIDEDKIPKQKFKSEQLVKSAIEASIAESIRRGEILTANGIKLKDDPEIETGKWNIGD